MTSTSKKKELPLGKRRQVDTSSEPWVSFEELSPGVSLPRLARPTLPGIDLAEWARAHRPVIEAQLHRHGAILFRGFGIHSPEAMNRLIQGISESALPYEERSSPRSQVSGNIYTSTDHPPSERIFPHSEQSYNLAFPRHLYFCCVTPSQSGGETPLADTRRVFARIPAAIRARFLEKGYTYVRNFGSNFGLTWQTAFQTDDPATVEAYCRSHGIEFEWREGNRLRTRQVRRAAARHPVTGEATWFNHATFFHVSTLPREVGAALLAEFGEENLPNNTYYGDGSPIEPEVVETLRAAYEAEQVSFPWERGDALLVENTLAAHARSSFVGPRLILAGMAALLEWDAMPGVTPGPDAS
ncbi:Taurine catabolism dioxygenase TauD/TfdA [Myxococcus stipitatus DSM 14675]|uniref:Taurine catabolism dioxygenase TauD/TfdA n=1 Tax=Myxococcus stipitatus (strain DSM 14675 / JCM 12634 / Mx s8) TaxID=1278073 RepID=L7U751_MYXSD|nr:TauD/TfdA family dioxygenase [Myxococcus stipitatus]AGC43392.1 Taurine catabolism dioxygenase TauD/TfdA [Myxococcus stipitatus DSM 14675]